jgi:hypothetical protein
VGIAVLHRWRFAWRQETKPKTGPSPGCLELVKLRFFAGLTMPEIAKVMKVSLATTERHWTYARTWLYAELSDPGNSPHG